MSNLERRILRKEVPPALKKPTWGETLRIVLEYHFNDANLRRDALGLASRVAHGSRTKTTDPTSTGAGGSGGTTTVPASGRAAEAAAPAPAATTGTVSEDGDEDTSLRKKLRRVNNASAVVAAAPSPVIEKKTTTAAGGGALVAGDGEPDEDEQKHAAKRRKKVTFAVEESKNFATATATAASSSSSMGMQVLAGGGPSPRLVVPSPITAGDDAGQPHDHAPSPGASSSSSSSAAVVLPGVEPRLREQRQKTRAGVAGRTKSAGAPEAGTKNEVAKTKKKRCRNNNGRRRNKFIVPGESDAEGSPGDVLRPHVGLLRRGAVSREPQGGSKLKRAKIDAVRPGNAKMPEPKVGFAVAAGADEARGDEDSGGALGVKGLPLPRSSPPPSELRTAAAAAAPTKRQQAAARVCSVVPDATSGALPAPVQTALEEQEGWDVWGLMQALEPLRRLGVQHPQQVAQALRNRSTQLFVWRCRLYRFAAFRSSTGGGRTSSGAGAQVVPSRGGAVSASGSPGEIVGRTLYVENAPLFQSLTALLLGFGYLVQRFRNQSAGAQAGVAGKPPLGSSRGRSLSKLLLKEEVPGTTTGTAAGGPSSAAARKKSSPAFSSAAEKRFVAQNRSPGMALADIAPDSLPQLIDIPIHPRTNKPCVFAFVEFTSVDIAMLARDALQDAWAPTWPDRRDAKMLSVIHQEELSLLKTEYKQLQGRNRGTSTRKEVGAGSGKGRSLGAQDAPAHEGQLPPSGLKRARPSSLPAAETRLFSPEEDDVVVEHNYVNARPRTPATPTASDVSKLLADPPVVGAPLLSPAHQTPPPHQTPPTVTAGAATGPMPDKAEAPVVLVKIVYSALEELSVLAIRQYCEHAVTVHNVDIVAKGEAVVRLAGAAEVSVLFRDVERTQRCLGRGSAGAPPVLQRFTGTEQLRYFEAVRAQLQEKKAKRAGSVLPNILGRAGAVVGGGRNPGVVGSPASPASVMAEDEEEEDFFEQVLEKNERERGLRKRRKRDRLQVPLFCGGPNPQKVIRGGPIAATRHARIARTAAAGVGAHKNPRGTAWTDIDAM